MPSSQDTPAKVTLAPTKSIFGVHFVILAVILLLWAVLGFWSLSERKRALESRETSLQQVVSSATEQTFRMFKLTEMSLLSITERLQRNPVAYPGEDPNFVAYVETLRRLTDALVDYRFADPEGNLFPIPMTSRLPVGNVFEREGIQIQRHSETRGLYISDPVLSRATGKWAVPITYPVVGKDGKISEISGNIEIEKIAGIFELQRLKPNGSIALIKANGTTLFRAPMSGNPIGRSIAGTKNFLEHLSVADHGLFYMPGAYDGVQRIVEFKKLPDYDLIVAATTTLDDALSDWRRETWIFGGSAAVATFLIFLLVNGFLKKAYKAERALRLSEQKFFTAFHGSPDAMVIAEIETGIIREVNESFSKTFGYSSAEVLGRSTVAIGLWPEAAKREETVSLMTKLGYLENYEVDHRTKDGRILAILVSAAQLEMDGVSCWAVHFRDISERKQRECAVEGERLRLRTTFETASDGIHVMDGDGLLVDANKAFLDILGYDSTAIGKLHVTDWDVQENWDVIKARLNELVTRRSKKVIETIHRRRDGTLVNVEVSTSGLEVEGKSYIYAASRDITERKKAADRINELASFNNQIISGAPVGIFLFRADGQCVTANPAAARLSGIAQEILVTQNFRELDSWRKSGLLDIALAALADNQVKEDEVHHHTSYDQEFWAIFRFAPLVVNGARHLLMIATDISEHKRAENQIRELAFYDPLTHLPNRRLLMDRLKQAMAASLRNEREGALLFVDLDNFKTVNDTLGHDKGDLLLQEVARRLTACFREADTVARIGGDEFVVVLANLSDDSEEAAGQARIVGEKVLAILGEPYQILGNEFRCTPSVGIALFGDQSGGLDELMKQADIAMYQAKAAGRHALRFFDPDLQTAIKARAEMEDDLRQGIEAGQLLLYYQPQVDDRGAWTGAEALVRWRHPLRGLVSPGEFIGLAEDTGLILPLGNWVLETACLQTVAWAKKPEMAHLTLAVNVSARQFHQANFVASVLAMVERTGADPRRLKLELTESTLLDNVQDIIDKMETLRARGFTFSLDDFGTGYSSLAYLKRLPLDQLKIDQSFVCDVLVDSNDAAIAETIVALAQSLKLNVIAEGVETRAQKDFLAAIGCHAYQGYFFGHPMPLEDFESVQRPSNSRLKSRTAAVGPSG